MVPSSKEPGLGFFFNMGFPPKIASVSIILPFLMILSNFQKIMKKYCQAPAIPISLYLVQINQFYRIWRLNFSETTQPITPRFFFGNDPIPNVKIPGGIFEIVVKVEIILVLLTPVKWRFLAVISHFWGSNFIENANFYWKVCKNH